MQKRIRQQVYAESTPIEKVLIPIGTVFQGVINFGNTVVENVWGLGCWLKDVHDVANPFLRLHREFQAFGTAREKLGEGASFSSVLNEQQAQAQLLHKKELIEALGFDPSQLTAEQFTEALDIACIVCTDPILWGIFSDFAIDYLKAQHFTEMIEVGVAGVLEMILLAIIIWVTLGMGVTAAVASQTRHLPKLKSIGELLAEFADATKAFNKHVKETAAKTDSDNSPVQTTVYNKDNEIGQGVQKTDPHGAETGSISNNQEKAKQQKLKATLKDKPVKMDSFEVDCFAPGDSVLKSPTFSGNKAKMEKEFYQQIKNQESRRWDQ